MDNEQLIDNTFVLRDRPLLELFDAVELIQGVVERAVFCENFRSKHFFLTDNIWKHQRRIYPSNVGMLIENRCANALTDFYM